MEVNKIIQGDCLLKLKELEDNSIDSIVTDPPYELGFMGKSWDSTGIANNKEMWAECLRVLKPGGHLLAFSGTRTYHRMACAIEDAGFEIRDMISNLYDSNEAFRNFFDSLDVEQKKLLRKSTDINAMLQWCYGSGFPKSLNIGKAVDKLQGNERKVVAIKEQSGAKFKTVQEQMDNGGFNDPNRTNFSVDKGTSEWEGWGTALKPAHEPICMARKPLDRWWKIKDDGKKVMGRVMTVAENCLKWGTGGINIDESRIEGRPRTTHKDRNYTGNKSGEFLGEGLGGLEAEIPSARFPANLIHDNSEEVRECFPESNSGNGKASTYDKFGGQWGKGKQIRNEDYGDSGNASRFFKSIIYQAKASKSERNKGMDELEEKEWKQENSPNPNREDRPFLPVKNNHPTVKPIALMEYLIKMVTPKGGIVLDPFAGSGTTGLSAKNLNRNYILIEKEPEYIDIINKRLQGLLL